MKFHPTENRTSVDLKLSALCLLVSPHFIISVGTYAGQIQRSYHKLFAHSDTAEASGERLAVPVKHQPVSSSVLSLTVTVNGPELWMIEDAKSEHSQVWALAVQVDHLGR